jgi:hypothetical protein
MIRSIAIAFPAVLLLAACGQQASDAASADDTDSTPIASAPSAADCAKVTLDVAPERFAEGRENFAVGTPARTRLDEAFTVAIAQACAEGMMAKQPLVDPRSKEKNTLFIANAPHANQATIYFRDGATWFEGPFFADGRHVQVPGPGAIKEAIYCHTVGATPEEQERTGRCLPD